MSNFSNFYEAYLEEPDSFYESEILGENNNTNLILSDLYMLEQGNIVITEAKFHFLPKFKEVPETKSAWKTLEEAEELLNMNGDGWSGQTANKVIKVALRVFDIYENVVSVISFPLMFTIIGIPYYLIFRLVSWGYRAGEEATVEHGIVKVLEKYKQTIAAEKDPKRKKALKDQEEKLQKKYKRFLERKKGIERDYND